MKTRYTAGAALGDAAIHGLHAQIMSHEFEGLDATEKAGIERALNRCRRLAAQIESELRNKRHERFVDKLSLADFYASLERAADVLGQQTRAPASVVKGAGAAPSVIIPTLSRA
jgi:glutathione S-transferase